MAFIEFAFVVVQSESLGALELFLCETVLAHLLAGSNRSHQTAENTLLLAAHAE